MIKQKNVFIGVANLNIKTIDRIKNKQYNIITKTRGDKTMEWKIWWIMVIVAIIILTICELNGIQID